MINHLTKEVKLIIQTLNQAGFKAYIVGGAVRDLLLGRVPQDFDIATEAVPDQIVAVCTCQGWKIIDKLGRNFGVVAVVIHNLVFEVATFRGESYGTDAHRPEQVWYGKSLAEDLVRRDFTINAMALALDGKLVDLFHGQQDLADRFIRTVGSAKQRFSEDALRMFRACRFASQLGFTVDQEAVAVMPQLTARVSGLALERVKAELCLILLADKPAIGLDLLVKSGLAEASCRVKEQGSYQKVAILPEIVDLVGIQQNPAFHIFDVWQHTLAAVTAVAPDLTLRWSALLHDVAKGRPGVRGKNAAGQITDYGHDKLGAQLAAAILQRLGFGDKFVKRVCWLVGKHMRFHFNYSNVLYCQGINSLRHWVREEARSGMFRTGSELTEAFQQLSAVSFADAYATGRGNLDAVGQQRFQLILAEILQSKPIHTSELAFTAKSIFTEPDERKLIGPCLKLLLQRVQDGNLSNNNEQLTSAAGKWLDRVRDKKKGLSDIGSRS